MVRPGRASFAGYLGGVFEERHGGCRVDRGAEDGGLKFLADRHDVVKVASDCGMWFSYIAMANERKTILFPKPNLARKCMDDQMEGKHGVGNRQNNSMKMTKMIRPANNP